MKLGDLYLYAQKAVLVGTTLETAAVAEGLLGAHQEAVTTAILGALASALTFWAKNGPKPTRKKKPAPHIARHRAKN